MQKNHSRSSHNTIIIVSIAIIVGSLALLLFIGGVGAYFLLHRTAVVEADPPDSAAPVQEKPAEPTDAAPASDGGTPNATTGSETRVLQTSDTSPPERKLRYGWRPGQPYSYEFMVEASINKAKIIARGGVNYTAKETGDEPEIQPEIREGVGSAFVVSDAGHLITCAHVVKGATQVECRIEGQKRTAEVIALDTVDDLALLKVSGGSWRPLFLGNSENVQLAQDVRVVGFPLTDVLGDSIKITSGTVAGFLDRDDGQLLQVDAPINAGVSGGPLVDETGRVVGVVSAKLSGGDISNVGLAVPVDRVKRLLDEHGVSIPGGNIGSQLSGPEIAKEVTPSVATLDVTIGSGGVGAEEQMTLAFQSHCRSAQTKPGGYTMGHATISFSKDAPKGDRGDLKVDAIGDAQDGGDIKAHLPFLLGPHALVAIEPLGDGQSWHRERTITLLTKKQQQNKSGFRGPMHVPFDPFNRRPKPKVEIDAVAQAFERIGYELGESTGETVLIKKRYELKTLDNDAAFKLEISGTGETVFDLVERVPRQRTFQGTFSVTENNVGLRIPVKFTVNRVEGDAVADSRKAMMNPNDPIAEPKQLADHELDDLLERIADRDRGKRWFALQHLMCAAPNERQAEVATALCDQLENKDPFTRERAALALRVWCDEEHVPAIISALDDTHWPVRRTATGILSNFRNARTAEAIAGIYKKDKITAKQALLNIGPIAEDATLTLLDESADWTVRNDACNILEKIGTAKSLPRLKEIYDRETNLVQSSAEKAIKAIRQRERDQEGSS